MAIRHLIRRFSPELDRRWVITGAVVIVLVVAASFIRWGGTPPPLELVALGPDGRFQNSVVLPPEWGDTRTVTADAVMRVPLILAARNPGTSAARPASLELSLPLRYRLTTRTDRSLEPRFEPGSPLLTYSLRPRLGSIEPKRLPVLLPAYDTLWLEVLVPAYYCVSLADSIIDFVPAPAPALESLASVRLFYSFEGGDLRGRQTGTLTIGMDTMMMQRPPAAPPPSFPIRTGRDLAMPEMGSLRYGGSRRSLCGDPDAPIELLSTVWETESGGRFIALDHGGRVRKHLFDLDGDGIIDRESWDPAGDGRFSATRQARLPIPEFLLPVEPARFDMARLDALPPDSQAALDPFRRAMAGPGMPPVARPDAAGAWPVAREAGALPPAAADTSPPARPRPRGPLGRPVPSGGGD